LAWPASTGREGALFRRERAGGGRGKGRKGAPPGASPQPPLPLLLPTLPPPTLPPPTPSLPRLPTPSLPPAPQYVAEGSGRVGVGSGRGRVGVGSGAGGGVSSESPPLRSPGGSPPPPPGRGAGPKPEKISVDGIIFMKILFSSGNFIPGRIKWSPPAPPRQPALLRRTSAPSTACTGGRPKTKVGRRGWGTVLPRRSRGVGGYRGTKPGLFRGTRHTRGNAVSLRAAFRTGAKTSTVTPPKSTDNHSLHKPNRFPETWGLSRWFPRKCIVSYI
jgi:hypothetical protein